MTNRIADAQLSRLSDLVARHLGLHFPKDRWLDLQRGVCAAAQEGGCQHGLDHYVQELLLPALTQKNLDAVASYLTVGETYFFREQRSLEVFEREIVPELIRMRTGEVIRIWSAGCATGEEPYSIAIMLSRLMAGLEKWNIEILATDLNSKSLQKASEGIYGEWSFRGVPPLVRSAYFEVVEKNRWALSSAIKQMVSFAQLNLADDFFPPPSHSITGFDVIFCRNVLMYFTPEGRRKVVRQLYCSLASDGWLIVSPTETSHELFSAFAAVNYGDVTLYRKSVTHLRSRPALPSVVRDENRFDAQLTEQRLENSEVALAPVYHPSQASQDRENKDHPIRSENAQPPAPSDEQSLALHEPGRYEDVQQIMGTLPSEDGKDAQAKLLLARGYANQGKLAVALACCDQAIAADKMDARAYYLRATILQEQGSLPEALFAFKQTVYAEPQFVLGHFSLGNLAWTQGRLRESEKHFENVLLLLAHSELEDVVPESEGLSAGRLREMIASRRCGAAAIVSGPGLPQPTFDRAATPRAERARNR
jgi:chemotaxis protein methyltransferase CheR